MNILHICSDYPYTQIYYQLLNNFSKKHNHIMYVPLNKSDTYDGKYDNIGENALIYSRDFTKKDRWFYKKKINKILKSIYKQTFINRCDFVHAHYLFSAGGVAYRLKKERNIDYIVAVRNTDLNFFFKYGLHLRTYAIKILEAANKIIFISPTYQNRMLEKYVPKRLYEDILKKSLIIPNGIDDYWHNNIFERTEVLNNDDVELLFVGEFTKNKNIPTIIKTVLMLRAEGIKARLTLVGDGSSSKEIDHLVENNLSIIKRFNWITSKDALKEIYRKAHIFIMPSINETFGLVYIEAISQGLPLIYTRNQGIDGYFTDGQVGYACDPNNVQEIVSNIVRIMNNYCAISKRCCNLVKDFSWHKISQRYELIYESFYTDKHFHK